MATITRAVALVLSLVLIPAGATADTVRLKTGGMIPQAQILSEEGDTVMLRTPGSRMGVPKSMIVRIEKETSVFDTYDKMRKNIKDSDGPGLFKLAQWCKDNGLREELHGTLSKLIEADPNHFVARHLLGHVRKGEGWEELPPLSIKVRMVGEKEFKEDVEQQLGIIFQTRRDFQLLEEDGTSESQGPTPVSFETKVTTGKMSEARFYKQFVRGATVWAEMALSVQGGFLGRTPTAISIQGEVASGLPSGEHLAVVDGFNRNHKKIHDFLDTIVEKRVASREPRRSEKADKTEKTGKGDKKKSEKKSEKKTDQKVEKPKTQSASTVL